MPRRTTARTILAGRNHPDDFAERPRHRQVERIEALRPIERDERDALLPHGTGWRSAMAHIMTQRAMNRAGFVGGPIRREDGAHGTTQ